MSLPLLSIHLSNHISAAETLNAVLRAESCGIPRVWFSEDLFFRGALPLAAAALAQTQRIGIGLGILVPQHRHPASIAMDVRTLLDLGEDRIILGIGAGVSERAERLGQTATPPLDIVRETVSAVRDLLSGQKINQIGGLHSCFELQLTGDLPPAIPPFYVAAVGPKALTQAGAQMDGVVLTMMCSREHARWASEQIIGAAAENSRGDIPIVAYLPIAVDEDRRSAKDRMRRVFANFIAEWSGITVLSKLFVDWSNLTQTRMATIREALAKNLSLDKLIPDELMDQYCISGTPEECINLIKEFHASGVTEIALDAGNELDSVLRFLTTTLAKV